MASKKKYQKEHRCERCGVPLAYEDVKKVQFLEMKPNTVRPEILTPRLMYSADLCSKCQMQVFEGFCKVINRD